MNDHAGRSPSRYDPVLASLSPLTVTERALCRAVAPLVPAATWLVIGPVMWSVAQGTAQPTPMWPLPTQHVIIGETPSLHGLREFADHWQPLVVHGRLIGGLLVSGAMPDVSPLLEQIAPLVDALFCHRMMTRHVIWQHLLSQLMVRYAAGEERTALWAEVVARSVGQTLPLPDRVNTVVPTRPLWPDAARFVELATAILHPDVIQARVLSLATAGVAHDINNLLTVILGRAQLLELDAEGEQRIDLQMIATAAEVGAMSARRLQRFAQLESLHIQPVDLVEIARLAIDTATHKLAHHAAITITESLSTLPVAAGETNLLYTALTALIVAAAQSNPDGGVIQVGSGFDERFVWIEVADPGLPPDSDLHSVSIQTQRAHTIELAIARQTARVHGGQLQIETNTLRGTVIRLMIPRFRREA